MYHIVDITQSPSVRVDGLTFNTYEECVEWIDNNGDIMTFSIEEDKN